MVVGVSSQIAFTPIEKVMNDYMLPNLLQNPNFTQTQGVLNNPVLNWNPLYPGSSVQVVNNSGAISGNAIQLTGVNNGLGQTVQLNQAKRRLIFFSAYSQSYNNATTQVADSDYSMYIDVRYMDGTSLYGQTVQFTPVNQDDGPVWNYQYGFIVPQKLVKSCAVYCLFRGKHQGCLVFQLGCC